jgi:hypothetical protein
MEVQWDYVHFDTTAEDVVTSDTVRVRVKITCVAQGKGAANLIPSVQKALAEVLPGAWQVIPGERREDAAGMEQVRLMATIRVEETKTDGVVNRIRNINRGGMRMELDDIDYRPPQLAIGRVLAELRREVYQSAQDEVARLNKALPGDCGPWRVGKIQISERQEAVQVDEAVQDDEPFNAFAPQLVRGSRSTRTSKVSPKPVGSGLRLRVSGTIMLKRQSVAVNKSKSAKVRH